MFPKLIRFISHIHLENIPYKTFEKGKPINKKVVRWLEEPSEEEPLSKADRSDILLLIEQRSKAQGVQLVWH